MLVKACINDLLTVSDFCSVQAYISISDLLIVFSKNMSCQEPRLDALVYTADSFLQSKLSNFLNENVFIEDEDGRE